MQGKCTNQGWKMKMEPIHRVQGTGSHRDFMIPWRSCCPNLIIWGCVDPVLAVGQQHQHLLGALRNVDSGTPLLLRQNLHCTSSLGNWCNYSSWKSNARLILWPGASVFNHLIFSKVGEQLFQETRSLLWALYSGLRTHDHHASLRSISPWGRFPTPPLAWLGPQAVTIIILVQGFAIFLTDHEY